MGRLLWGLLDSCPHWETDGHGGGGGGRGEGGERGDEREREVSKVEGEIGGGEQQTCNAGSDRERERETDRQTDR